MPQALEFISGQATAPSSTLTALTMSGTDTLTIRNADITKRNYLLGLWARNNAAGIARVYSPRMHDVNQGIRVRIPATSGTMTSEFFPVPYPQIVFPTDTLTAQISGSAVAGQIEQLGMLFYYDDVPGVASTLVAPADAMKGPQQIMSQEVTLTAGSAGGYSGGAAVNSNFDNWQAGKRYALIGGMVDADCLAITVKGIDVGNLRVAFPGASALRFYTAKFFWHLSNDYGIPLIPVFQANNRGAITVEVVTNQAGGTFNVTLFFYLLT